MKTSHPVPRVGDVVVLNAHGIAQCFGSVAGLSHMQTLRMKVTSIDSESATDILETFPLDVDNPDVDMFLIDNWCFDIVETRT